jgi:hypothetical protein
MSVRFALAPAKRYLTMRRSLSLVGLGAVLFLGSAIAMRVRTSSWLYAFGAAGAVLLIVGVRRLLVGSRPLSVGENAVWFGTHGVALREVEAVEVQKRTLAVRYGGGRHREEELAEPAAAAAEIARRAGLRPPRKGGPQRWERRVGAEEEES